MTFYAIAGALLGIAVGIAIGYRIGYDEALSDMGRKR